MDHSGSLKLYFECIGGLQIPKPFFIIHIHAVIKSMLMQVYIFKMFGIKMYVIWVNTVNYNDEKFIKCVTIFSIFKSGMGFFISVSVVWNFRTPTKANNSF